MSDSQSTIAEFPADDLTLSMPDMTGPLSMDNPPVEYVYAFTALQFSESLGHVAYARFLKSEMDRMPSGIRGEMVLSGAILDNNAQSA